MLNRKVWALTLGCWMAISFTICVIGGVVAPGLPIPHRTLELLLPGFVWVSPGSFVVGILERFSSACTQECCLCRFTMSSHVAGERPSGQR
jgi:hypothetical protein